MATTEPTANGLTADELAEVHVQLSILNDRLRHVADTIEKRAKDDGGPLPRLISAVMADDEGRRVLAGIVAAELAKRELTVRGLHVVDDQGRKRVRMYAGATSGGVEVLAQKAPDQEQTRVGLVATEELVTPENHRVANAGVYFSSAGNPVGQVEVVDAPHGREGACVLWFGPVDGEPGPQCTLIGAGLDVVR